MLGAVLLGTLLAGPVFNPNPPFRVGVTSALPDDPDRARRAEEKRRAAKPGASAYAKSNG